VNRTNGDDQLCPFAYLKGAVSEPYNQSKMGEK